jgi:hypothetical protein
MTTELAVQIPQNIPSYVVSMDQARAMNADAIQGISTGFPPSIRTKANKFRIVDGDGNETILKPADLVNGEELAVVVLAARPAIHKVFYAAAYDPNQSDALAPDCFSIDGVTPDPSVKKPCAQTCAGCPNNAFGSGRNAAGQATKGKACSDNKILAVTYKGLVYQFKIPPASLKNFGVYVKNLITRGVPIGNVVTFIKFDDDADYSVFQFRAGGFVPENAIARMAALAQSQEVLDIVRPQVALPAPAGPAPKALEETMKKAEQETAAPAEEPAPTTSKRGRPKKEAAVQETAAPAQAAAVETPAPAPAPAAAVASDDELRALLGL